MHVSIDLWILESTCYWRAQYSALYLLLKLHFMRTFCLKILKELVVVDTCMNCLHQLKKVFQSPRLPPPPSPTKTLQQARKNNEVYCILLPHCSEKEHQNVHYIKWVARCGFFLIIPLSLLIVVVWCDESRFLSVSLLDRTISQSDERIVFSTNERTKLNLC